MNSNHQYVSKMFRGVAVGCIAVLVSLAAGQDARAQIRPAYTKNVDERGRMPYEVYIEFTQSSCSFNCSNFGSFGGVRIFDGPAVPAGKRLIIEHVSGRLPNSDSAGVQVALQSQQIISQQNVKWAYFGPFFGFAGGLQGFQSSAFTTYGPGEQPHFNLVLLAATNFIAYITVSGYLIDASN